MSERDHQEAWYARAIEDRFFERRGFERLIAWNLRALRRAVPLRRESRILSIGCGLGHYEMALAPHVAGIVAIDLADTAIREASRRAAARNIANVKWRRASVFDLELPAASFDVVIAMGVLHHVPLPQRTALLRNVRRWLRADGWFYARDPNARGLLRRIGTPFYRSKSPFHSPEEADMDPRSLVAELKAADFGVAHVHYTDVFGGPLPWIVRTNWSPFWSVVFAADATWLAMPGLRTLASQFSVTARP
jgi:2-polyprenyl-3-methyl-5-hydroxy-6-metoxy-1,4-benzoquinol methylase